jgi:hypothetical protein
LEGRALLSGSTAAIYPIGTTLQADVASPVEARERVPFRGRLVGEVTRTPLNPPLVSALVEGTGQAAHLGRYTFTFQNVVNTSTMIGTGTLTITAANGDTLTADVTGTAGPSGTPNVVHVVETATITGGTGRFADATGGFTVERYFNMTTGETYGTIEGTISPPGARSR